MSRSTTRVRGSPRCFTRLGITAFWDADTKKFVEAKDLTVGTHLRDDHAKTTQIVTAVVTWTVCMPKIASVQLRLHVGIRG
jgi:hypothetical protein